MFVTLNSQNIRTEKELSDHSPSSSTEVREGRCDMAKPTYTVKSRTKTYPV